jgi:hypothetical protein
LREYIDILQPQFSQHLHFFSAIAEGRLQKSQMRMLEGKAEAALEPSKVPDFGKFPETVAARAFRDRFGFL